MGRQIFKIGKYKYHMEYIPIEELPPNDEIVGPEPDSDFIYTIREEGIVYPIVLTDYDDEKWLIDGGRRIKTARILDYKEMVAMIVHDVSPMDRAAWTIILNSQRSLNPIAEYRYLKQIQEDNWEEFSRRIRADKSHVVKIMSIDKIDESYRETFIKGYENGTIAEGTLFKVTKLSVPRQALALSKFETKGTLTGDDVAHVSKANTNAVLAAADAGMFGSVEIPEDIHEVDEAPEYVFAIVDGDKIVGPWFDFNEAHEEWLQAEGNWRLYRLVEV